MQDVTFEVRETPGRSGGLTLMYRAYADTVDVRLHDGQKCIAVGTYLLESLLAAVQACVAVGRANRMRSVDIYLSEKEP